MRVLVAIIAGFVGVASLRSAPAEPERAGVGSVLAAPVGTPATACQSCGVRVAADARPAAGEVLLAQAQAQPQTSRPADRLPPPAADTQTREATKSLTTTPPAAQPATAPAQPVQQAQPVEFVQFIQPRRSSCGSGGCGSSRGGCSSGSCGKGGGGRRGLFRGRR